MPVHVEKSPRGGWDIVGPEGRVGHSDSRRKAEISASIRNRAYKEKTKKQGQAKSRKGR